MKAWTEIPELKDASGIGVYTTTFELGADWKPVDSALLSLGSVTDSFTVRVNGKPVGFVDQLGAVTDIGDHLRPGSNTIEVTVATTLINRLRTLNPKQSTWPAQPNGLVGR